MFSVNTTQSKVFAIYEDSYRYHIYDFNDLNEPKIIKSGETAITAVSGNAVNDYFLWFLENDSGKPKSLKDLMKVKASITYRGTLILMSDQMYCRVNLNADIFEKKVSNINFVTILKTINI